MAAARDPARLLGDIRADIEHFLSSDTPALAAREVELLNRNEDKPLPTTLASAWWELRELDNELGLLKAEKKTWEAQSQATEERHSREMRVLRHKLSEAEAAVEAERTQREALQAAASSAGHRENSTIQDLRRQQRFLHDEDAKNRHKAAQSSQTLTEKCRALEHELSMVRMRAGDAEDELRVQFRAAEDGRRAAERRAAAASATISSLEREVESLQAQVERTRRSLDVLRNVESERDRLQAALDAQSGARPDHTAASDTYVRSLQAELQRYQTVDAELRSARRENAALSARATNVELMKEEVATLQSRLERAQAAERAALDRAEAAEARVGGGGEGDDTWARAFRKLVPAATTLDQVLAAFTGLQKDAAVRAERVGQLEGEVQRLKSAASSTESMDFSLRQRIAALEDEKEEADSTLRRHARQFSLAGREREAYNAIMKTYTQEDASLREGERKTTPEQTRISELEGLLRTAMETVSSLETELEEKGKATLKLKQEIRNLEAKLKGMGGDQPVAMDTGDALSGSAEAEARTLKAEVESLRAENAVLEKEVGRLAEAAGTMETRLAQGHYNPATTKVVHLGMNPAKKAQERLQQEREALAKENAELRARLAAIDSNSSFGTVATTPNTSGEEIKLREALKAAEKMNARLKEVFKQKIGQFREATYELLGYRIDLSGSSGGGRFKLRSMYAEHEDDHLLFQANDNRYELLETPFSKSLSNEIQAYLVRCHSIPAFLAHTTTELWNRQTFMG